MNWLRRVSGIPLSPPAAAATEGFNAMVQTKNFPLETRGEAVSREALVQAALQEITQNYREASLSNVARSYGVSLAYVSECVRAQTGKTYKELLQKHRMETAARLLRRDTAGVTADRVAACRELAVQTGAIVVLKGAGTVISMRSSRTWINPTGSPMLATGGSGDVLAGMIGAMFAQGYDMVESVLAAVYFHGLSAEGLEAGFTAGEIAPNAMALVHDARVSYDL